jgi:hypothetical protein
MGQLADNIRKLIAKHGFSETCRLLGVASGSLVALQKNGTTAERHAEIVAKAAKLVKKAT